MKKLLALALALVMTASVVGCASTTETATTTTTTTTAAETTEAAPAEEAATTEEAAPAAEATSDDPYVIDVFMKSNAGDFWVALSTGAMTAAADLGVEVSVFACDTETNYEQQTQQVESSISRGVDAIAIACLDTEAIVPVVEQANDAGIKVLTFNSMLNTDVVYAHIATDNWVAGEMAGKALGEAMGGTGTYCVLGAAEGVQNNRDRSDGCIAYITENFPDMELISNQYMDNDMTIATAIVNDWITANPDLGGIFANNENGTIAVATVLQERSKVGEIINVGFDATVQTVSQIDNGITAALVSQQPFMMGYLAVTKAVDVLNGVEVESLIDTGALLVDASNTTSDDVNAIIYPGQ